jgi:hypothetical protein
MLGQPATRTGHRPDRACVFRSRAYRPRLALTTNSDGAPQTIAIATSSAAHRAITVTTGGGQLLISSGKIPGNYGPPPMIIHQPIGSGNTHSIGPAPQASTGIEPEATPAGLP